MSLRLMWCSNSPLASTGYGNQTKLFAPRFVRAGHPSAVLGFYGVEGSMLNWEGIQLYPKHLEPFGQDVVGAHAKHFNADAIMTLIDAWVMKPEHYDGVPWIAWAPIDMEPNGDPRTMKVVDKLHQAAVPIAYSKFGLDVMRAGGLDALYVPHGVDCAEFSPMPQAEARQSLGFPLDRYVVGMVAANKGWPSRKALPEHMAAFAAFKSQHPDALLYVHTSLGEHGEYGGVPLVTIAAGLGLEHGRDWVACDQYANLLGFSTEHMRRVYNAMDVFMNVSCGEGFGIPALEAQACGVPVIVGNWTACPELCFSGFLVDKCDAQREWNPLNSWWFRPRAEAIAAKLDEAYRATDMAARREQARTGALAYDADKVMAEQWLPALAECEERINAPVEVAPALRRAA